MRSCYHCAPVAVAMGENWPPPMLRRPRHGRQLAPMSTESGRTALWGVRH